MMVLIKSCSVGIGLDWKSVQDICLPSISFQSRFLDFAFSQSGVQLQIFDCFRFPAIYSRHYLGIFSLPYYFRSLFNAASDLYDSHTTLDFQFILSTVFSTRTGCHLRLYRGNEWRAHICCSEHILRVYSLSCISLPDRLVSSDYQRSRIHTGWQRG